MEFKKIAAKLVADAKLSFIASKMGGYLVHSSYL
jgi:hypothetical protein